MATTRRIDKDRVCKTHLLRRSSREGGTVNQKTLGNLSRLPAEFIDVIRRSLQHAQPEVAGGFLKSCGQAHMGMYAADRG